MECQNHHSILCIKKKKLSIVHEGKHAVIFFLTLPFFKSFKYSDIFCLITPNPVFLRNSFSLYASSESLDTVTLNYRKKKQEMQINTYSTLHITGTN